MKKIVLVAGIALAQLCAVSAFAQGEVGPVKKAAPYTKVSPEEKADARAHRKEEGAAALKEQPNGEVGAVPAAKPPAKLTKEQKADARAERRAKAAADNKAGTMPKNGEVGPTK